jgi:hypothetical protein
MTSETILAIVNPRALFGPITEFENNARKLLKQWHPDLADEKDKASYTVVFQHISILRDKGKLLIQKGSYDVSSSTTVDPDNILQYSCNIAGKEVKALYTRAINVSHAVLYIGKTHYTYKFLSFDSKTSKENCYLMLKALDGNNTFIGAHKSEFVPHAMAFLPSIIAYGHDKEDSYYLALKRNPGDYLLLEILEEYKFLEEKHLKWLINRLLSAVISLCPMSASLAAISKYHSFFNFSPETIVVNVDNHTAFLLDWYFHTDYSIKDKPISRFPTANIEVLAPLGLHSFTNFNTNYKNTPKTVHLRKAAEDFLILQVNAIKRLAIGIACFPHLQFKVDSRYKDKLVKEGYLSQDFCNFLSDFKQTPTQAFEAYEKILNAKERKFHILSMPKPK